MYNKKFVSRLAAILAILLLASAALSSCSLFPDNKPKDKDTSSSDSGDNGTPEDSHTPEDTSPIKPKPDTADKEEQLTVVTLADILKEKKSTITLDGSAVANAELTVISPENRAKTENGELIYICEQVDGFSLQTEALSAFNLMMDGFYHKTKLTNIYIKNAYNNTENADNSGFFQNALAVKINKYAENGEASTVYGIPEYKWIYENAYKYGFVRASGALGEEDIFVYVGSAYSTAIYDRQTNNTDTFYSVLDYVGEIKESDIQNVMQSVGHRNGVSVSVNYHTYYMASDSKVFKLPNSNFDYIITELAEGGYIVSYWNATSLPGGNILEQKLELPEDSSEFTLPSLTADGSYLSTGKGMGISGISSKSAVLVDMNKNTLVAGINADTKIYPASLTKLMTILVACENAKSAGVLLTVTEEMIAYEAKLNASSSLGFKVGEQMSVEDALYLINYRSDVVTSLLVAEYIAGDEEAFVELMNEKAKELGLKGTHFVNSTGMHSDSHYSTCRDMAAIMSAVMSNSAARRIVTSFAGRTVRIYEEGAVIREPVVYASWYNDAGRLNGNAQISGTNIKIIAGRTGYEDISSACYATVALDASSGKQYICITVGRTDASQSTVSATQCTKDTKDIYKNYI